LSTAETVAKQGDTILVSCALVSSSLASVSSEADLAHVQAFPQTYKSLDPDTAYNLRLRKTSAALGFLFGLGDDRIPTAITRASLATQE